MEEAVDKLWPDRDYDNRVKALYRKAVIGIHSLLEAQGVPEVFCNRRGVCYLMEDQVECDFYDFLRHQNNREELYSGEYMFEYSWAEETNAWLQKLEDDLKLQKIFDFPRKNRAKLREIVAVRLHLGRYTKSMSITYLAKLMKISGAKL